jgi:hypothetical protein
MTGIDERVVLPVADEKILDGQGSEEPETDRGEGELGLNVFLQYLHQPAGKIVLRGRKMQDPCCDPHQRDKDQYKKDCYFYRLFDKHLFF